MKERPILFSTLMVKTILNNTKTMTRRILNPRPPEYVGYFDLYNGLFRAYMPPGEPCSAPGSTEPFRIKPRYEIGDRLWVRETWAENMDKAGNPIDILEKEYLYKADGHSYLPKVRWKSSMFMPRRVARIFLKITDVKIERLQEITNSEAIAEGVTKWLGNSYGMNLHIDFDINEGKNAIAIFSHLWDSLNAKRGYSWNSNPWVYCITFEKVNP